MTNLRANDVPSMLETIWNALEGYRDYCIPDNDVEWSDICTAMAWIEEDLSRDE